MALSFRTANIDDVGHIASIGHHSYLHHSKNMWHCPDELQCYVQEEYHQDKIRSSLSQPLDQWWVVAQPQPIGFVKLRYDQEICVTLNPAPNLQPLERGVFLNKIYLLPQYTGQGLGKRFLQFIEKHLQQQQEKCFWLEVLQDNHPAKKFYLQQGMHIIGDGYYRYTHQQHHMHLMYKELAKHPTTSC